MKQIFEELMMKYHKEALNYVDREYYVDKESARRIVTEALGAAGKVLSDTYGRGPESAAAELYARKSDLCDINRKTQINNVIKRLSDIFVEADIIDYIEEDKRRV